MIQVPVGRGQEALPFNIDVPWDFKVLEYL
jgi:hypothetical protein